MTLLFGGVGSGTSRLSNEAGSAWELPPEQKPPQSINCRSGVCIARLMGMTSMFRSRARQAIQGLMRLSENIDESSGGAVFDCNGQRSMGRYLA